MTKPIPRVTPKPGDIGQAEQSGRLGAEQDIRDGKLCLWYARELEDAPSWMLRLPNIWWGFGPDEDEGAQAVHRQFGVTLLHYIRRHQTHISPGDPWGPWGVTLRQAAMRAYDARMREEIEQRFGSGILNEIAKCVLERKAAEGRRRLAFIAADLAGCNPADLDFAAPLRVLFEGHESADEQRTAELLDRIRQVFDVEVDMSVRTILDGTLASLHEEVQLRWRE